ncbi:MAG: dehypoxanthine futalosine cyclase [Leptospiraceae bacterium]|nr:dehypoxanthine futalosine cyclase [Leptospiraceae bacterium]
MQLFANDSTDAILKKALGGTRISREEALELYENGDFLKIQAVARELRNRKVSPAIASYTAFRVVNYTNYCNVECSFCSFMDEIGNGKGYVLSKDDIIKKMDEALAQGADQMFLQGGVYPDLAFDYYLDVIRGVKDALGANIHIRAFSPVELRSMAEITGRRLADVLRDLKSAGLDSVPGAGAEILTERMRKILSPKKATTEQWVEVMETCHREGLPGSANVVFGSEETTSEVIEHLEVIRQLQDRTGGFKSFIPWTFQKQTKKFYVRSVPAQEYLKVLGICRIFLDNIDHIETSLMVLGQGVGQLALNSGADDISSIVIEENVLRSYGIKSEEKARKFLQESGFVPVRRDLLYNYLDLEGEAVRRSA